MSDPKALLILKEIQARLQVIDGSGLYFTRIGRTVIRGQRRFSENELPASACFMAPRSLESESGERAKMAASVVIEAHHATGTHPEDTALQMLADIQRAVELDDETLGRLLTGRLAWAGDQVSYPEEAGGFVSVQAVYLIPHIRHYGDPAK
ncbi:MAG: hypothetical protein DRQ61_09050 [Gammaproteobacteria bacterium]|nr:MAG: hypothetical protein DRQ61_09050 [Gammaproteobacteria bacterium]